MDHDELLEEIRAEIRAEFQEAMGREHVVNFIRECELSIEARAALAGVGLLEYPTL